MCVSIYTLSSISVYIFESVHTHTDTFTGTRVFIYMFVFLIVLKSHFETMFACMYGMYIVYGEHNIHKFHFGLVPNILVYMHFI